MVPPVRTFSDEGIRVEAGPLPLPIGPPHSRSPLPSKASLNFSVVGAPEQSEDCLESRIMANRHHSRSYIP